MDILEQIGYGIPYTIGFVVGCLILFWGMFHIFRSIARLFNRQTVRVMYNGLCDDNEYGQDPFDRLFQILAMLARNDFKPYDLKKGSHLTYEDLFDQAFRECERRAQYFKDELVGMQSNEDPQELKKLFLHYLGRIRRQPEDYGITVGSLYGYTAGTLFNQMKPLYRQLRQSFDLNTAAEFFDLMESITDWKDIIGFDPRKPVGESTDLRLGEVMARLAKYAELRWDANTIDEAPDNAVPV